jgi:hypothetical protein
MRLKLTIILLSMAISLPVLSDEISPPEFTTPPIEFVNQHEIAFRWDNDRLEKVEDVFLIGDFKDQKATFYLKTIGNNHHMCHVVGNAEKEDGGYIFSYKDCQLKIEYTDIEAKVIDAGGKCKNYFCGMMAYLNSEFKKK